MGVTKSRCEGYLMMGARPFVNLFGREPRRSIAGWERCTSKHITHQVASGCAHEHVVTWLVCAECAANLAERRQSNKPAQCVTCIHLDECGSGCRIFLTIGELTEAVAS